MKISRVPFNRPYLTGKELPFVQQACEAGVLAGDGRFTAECQAWIEKQVGCEKALLTHSCTGALEMAAILAGIGPGDEVVMPSFTFTSTANAIVLRGGVPVFVDIRADTLNIDERRIEAAIGPRTRAIMAVHYAGVGCEMDMIMDLASHHRLEVIEDAAQGIMATYKGKPLGSFGSLSALSFHETKNLVSGQGGALLINDKSRVERAEVVWQKGTNRNKFFRGQVDKYTWTDVGSSFTPGEITAAFLWAQLLEADAILERRLKLWTRYHDAFADLESAGKLLRPTVPPHCKSNGHIYYLILPSKQARTALIRELAKESINATFHYVPLHSSPAGRRYGRAIGELKNTDDLSERLVRLPLWVGMEDAIVGVIEAVDRAVRSGSL